jgi:hypothetical protein
MGADGFATTFMYTESHIKNVLIPQLNYLRNYYEARDNDSSKIYAVQIDAWQQTLKLNEDLKKKSTFIENRSFSSGVSYEAFQEIATKQSTSLELSVYIELGVALEAGIEIGGSGVSGGVEIKVRTELGIAANLSQMKSKKTGFILNDDDGGDAYTVNILKDEVYATPVFKVVSGTTSCPWEPGTQPREGVQVTSDIYLANVDDPNGTAVFHLQLGNISQSDEDRLYNLVFDQASNPDGAVITLGGSQVQGGIPTPYYVQANKYAEATVTVRRGPDAFKYDNLRFRFLSGCSDEAIADTLLLDVNYASPCSNINMAKPLNNWILSSYSNNRLKVEVGNYNRDLLDFVKIQIAQAGTSNWQTVSFLDKADLDPATTDATVLLDQYQDGEYDLRALVGCSAGLLYSELVTGGKIDRRGPELFGLPEPSDLVLDSGDMIAATFNETINGFKIAASNIAVTNLSKKQNLSATWGWNDNMVTVIPDLSGESFEGDTFNVELTGIEDLYGNSMTDTVSWAFVILADPGNEDCDEDGIINSSDNCPCTANPLQEDIDANGIGDACEINVGIEPEPGEGFRFYENYPNPFSDKTTLIYSLPFESHVTMRVFDIVGNEVAVLISDDIMPGTWEVTWNSEGFSNGIYFCTIYAESNVTNDVAVKTIKMLKAR